VFVRALIFYLEIFYSYSNFSIFGQNIKLMAVSIKGDKNIASAPSINHKALKINLNENIYGSFSEIGAGQETARNFFRAGASSGTIAKAMSAYSKEFSDAIYGAETDGRYVTKNRLQKMLRHETNLLEQRLDRKENADKIYFTYANTVATIDFAKKFKGHGWLGIRFQMSPLEDYNEIILHVRFHENDSIHQQVTLGKIGVNLIYGAFYHNDNPKDLLNSLYDHIDVDKIEIDVINFSGPRFTFVDNRLMSLLLVKNGFTDAVMFGPEGVNLLPADELYKKNILALRGSFRPVTKLAVDMFEKGYNMFIKENNVDKKNTDFIFEMTLDNLSQEGSINEKDFLDRVNLLGSLNHTVMITNFREYYRLIEYFSRFTKEKTGLIMGTNHLIKLFDESYYRNLSGGIMEAFGKLFFKKLKLYIYPYRDRETDKIICSENLELYPRVQEFYDYFKHNGRFIDLENYKKEYLNIYAREIIKKIQKGETGWESSLPEGIAEKIKSNYLFGYKKVVD